MGGIGTSEQKQAYFPTVLLCFPGDAQTSAKLLSEPFCGKSLLFHQILYWHTAGARKILLSVETMPGSLVAVIDELALHGIIIDMVRSAAEVSAHMDSQDLLLLAKAEIWFKSDIIAHVAAAHKKHIFTVEENTENKAFERIDLNSRWAGIGLIDKKILESLHDLPDGWDMASSLLRQALQQQPELLMVRQADVLAGDVVHFSNRLEYKGLFPNRYQPSGWGEFHIFNALTQHIAKHSWQNSISHTIALWAFPLLCVFSLALVSMEWFGAAAVLAMVAIWTADIRIYVLSAEYRQRQIDIPQIAAWIVLLLSLCGALYLSGDIAFDALLYSALLSGLSLLSAKMQRQPIISPLIIAPLIMVGAVFGALSIVVKLLLALQLVVLLSSSHSKTDIALKPN